MPRNQRLYDAIRQSGRGLEGIADELETDPKTVGRWISDGRLPCPALRQKLAQLVGIPEGVLWPDAPGVAYGTSELVGIYTTRRELPPATVRVCLGDPDSEAVALRGREEGIGDALAARCRLATSYARGIHDADSRAVRITGATLYASILRFDNDVLLNTHLWGNAAADSPVFHFRKDRNDGIAARAITSFERVWRTAQVLPEG